MTETAGPWNIGKRAPEYTAGQPEDVGQGPSESSVRFGGDLPPCAFPIVVIELSRYE